MRPSLPLGRVERVFASPSATRPPRPAVPPALAARVRPLSATGDQLLPLSEALAPLLPGGALRRGTTVVVTGHEGLGATTLAFGLLAAATAAGGWCAVAGVADPGAVALAELGVDLWRLALVPAPGSRWADTVAALVDGLDVVVVHPPGPARPTLTRHLVARTRDRRSVLVVLGRRPKEWPEAPDVRLDVVASRWWGTERGHGCLRARLADVEVRVRRRPGVLRHRLWLPDPHGRIAAARPR